jgi:hypothetical protein
MAGIGSTALFLPALAKGKDDWLTEQAFKRAQGLNAEQEDDASSFEGEGFEEPEVFTPGRERRYEFGFQRLDEEASSPRIIRRQADWGDDSFDPEPDLSIGSPKSPDDGFETYQPPKLVPLQDRSLSAGVTDPLASAVLRQLQEGQDAPSVTEQQRDAIITFYRFNNFQPLWVSAGAVNARATSVLPLLSAAEEDGLNSDDYALPRLATIGTGSSTLSPNLPRWPLSRSISPWRSSNMRSTSIAAE